MRSSRGQRRSGPQGGAASPTGEASAPRRAARARGPGRGGAGGGGPRGLRCRGRRGRCGRCSSAPRLWPLPHPPSALHDSAVVPSESVRRRSDDSEHTRRMSLGVSSGVKGCPPTPGPRPSPRPVPGPLPAVPCCSCPGLDSPRGWMRFLGGQGPAQRPARSLRSRNRDVKWGGRSAFPDPSDGGLGGDCPRRASRRGALGGGAPGAQTTPCRGGFVLVQSC